MFTPSNIRVEDSDLKIKRIDQGLYMVENAYDGDYEYFSVRPIMVVDAHSASLHATNGSDVISPFAPLGEQEQKI